MKKVMIEIPENTDIPEGKTSTYFKIVDGTNATKIKEILDGGIPHNHIFVGENEFIKFLQNATGISGVMKITPINKVNKEYEYTEIETDKIPTSEASDISAIIQS